MSAIPFPAVLPKPTVDFNGEVVPEVIETKMDSGRTRRRRRFSGDVHRYRVRWQMSDFEFGLFQAWHKNKISSGADPFTISVPTGGDGFKTIEAEFGNNGRYAAQHDKVLYWNVSAVMETNDALVWDDATYELLLTIGDPVALESSSSHLHSLVHTTLPVYF